MNNRELRIAVAARNAIPDTGDGLAGHTDINASIGAALTDISAEYRWPWLLTSASVTFSTTTGLGPIPAACTQIDRLLINLYPARSASREDVWAATSPYTWADVGANVLLYPIPAAVPTATLWFWQDEPAMSIDTSIPLLPVSFHRLIVARASYHLNVRRGENDRVAQDLTEYQSGLKNLMQTVQRTSGPKKVRDAFRAQRWARW